MEEKKFKVIRRRRGGGEHEEFYTLEKLLARILNELESKENDCDDIGSPFSYKVEEIESDE